MLFFLFIENTARGLGESDVKIAMPSLLQVKAIQRQFNFLKTELYLFIYLLTYNL